MVRMGVNKVGGKKDHPLRSKASKDAHRSGVPRPRTKLKERVIKVDERRTTFGRLLDKDSGRVLPKSPKELRKGKFEKLPGTRIQNNPGGQPVRVVVESGKEFPPGSMWSCKQHMLKLAKERKEAEEIARMRGDELPKRPEHAAGEALTPEEEETAKAKAVEAAAVRLAESRAAVKRKREGKDAEPPPLTKKERKAQQREAKRRRFEELRIERLAAGERELLGESRYSAEVVSREKGFAWIRIVPLSAEEQPLSEAVAAKVREARAKALALPGAAGACGAEGATGDELPLWFFDVAEQGLNLQPGARLMVRLYRDARGAGACEAQSVATA